MSDSGGNVEKITVESDERGFELHIDVDDGDQFTFNIHSCAEALHEQVNLIIGGWLAEGQAAARMPASAVFRCSPEDVDESGGYALSDPKHPAFHSVHADIWDAREGK